MSLQVPGRQTNGTSNATTKAVILVSSQAFLIGKDLTEMTGRRPVQRNSIQAPVFGRAQSEQRASAFPCYSFLILRQATLRCRRSSHHLALPASCCQSPRHPFGRRNRLLRGERLPRLHQGCRTGASPNQDPIPARVPGPRNCRRAIPLSRCDPQRQSGPLFRHQC